MFKNTLLKPLYISIALTLFGVSVFSNLSFKSTKGSKEVDFSLNKSQSLNGGEILSLLTNDIIPEEEKDFLNQQEYKLYFDKNPNSSNYECALLNDDLYVFVDSYSYKDINNIEQIWTPNYISYNNKDYYFVKEENRYTSIITDYNPSITTMDISYYLNNEIDKDLANEIISITYQTGKQYKEEIDLINQNNDALKQKYENDLLKYEEYLKDLEEFPLKQEQYNQYVIEKSIYDIELEKYNEYASKYEKYLLDKKAYDQYLSDLEQYNQDAKKYAKYLSDLEYYNANHEQNLIDYQEFVQKYSTYQYRLDAMDIIFKVMTPLKRSIYSAVMGDTVSSVLKQKDKLVSALNVSGAVIDSANQATVDLRMIFQDYTLLSTNKLKYAYYFNNYSKIKRSVEDLLRSLDKLYRSGLVAKVMQSEGKEEKYLILVAQLAYLANAIDDKSVYNYEAWNGISGDMSKPNATIIDSNWKIGGKTYLQILDGEDLLDTTQSAYPTNPNYPDNEVILLVKPEKVEKPEKPKEVKMPVEPNKVNKPNELPVVEKPVYPNKVDQPIQPEYQIIDPNKLPLAKAYEQERLLKRDEFITNPVVTINDSVTVEIENIKKLARFYNEDQVVHNLLFLKKGITYNGVTPFKEPDSYFNDYVFSGWVNEMGEDIDLSEVEESCVLYSSFIGGNVKKYDVTWEIGNEKIIQQYKYDETPIAPNDVGLPDSEDEFFVFVSWDKEITPVTDDITYIAVFDSHPIFTICFNIDGNIQSQKVRENEMPIVPNNITKEDSEEFYYEFSNWDKNIVAACQNETYNAIFNERQFVIVTWDINGVLTKEKYKQDDIVSYKGDVPFIEETGDFYYVFVGWNYDFSKPVKQNITIQAMFEQYIFYKICWNIDGRLYEEKYKDGEIPVCPVIPTKENDETSFYIFDRWNFVVSEVKRNITYKAIFNQYDFVKENNVAVKVLFDNNNLNIYCTRVGEAEIDISNLIKYLKDNDVELSKIIFISPEYSLSLSKSQMNLLLGYGVCYIDFSYSHQGSSNYDISFTVLNKNKEIINNEALTYSILFGNQIDETHCFVYEGEKLINVDFLDGKVQISAKFNAVYSIRYFYTISITPLSNGELTTDKMQYMAGETVKLTYELDPGFEILDFYYKDAYGRRTNITDNSFIMPDKDITLCMILTMTQYEITFIANDKVIAVEYHYYGEYPSGPTFVYKAPDEVYRYLFTGWNNELEMVSGDATYVAVFTPIEIIPEQKPSSFNVYELIKWSVVGVGGAGILLGGFFITKKFILKK